MFSQAAPGETKVEMMLPRALAASSLLSLGHFFLPALPPHLHLTGRLYHLLIPDHPAMPLSLLLLHLPLLFLCGAAGMRRGLEAMWSLLSSPVQPWPPDGYLRGTSNPFPQALGFILTPGEWSMSLLSSPSPEPDDKFVGPPQAIWTGTTTRPLRNLGMTLSCSTWTTVVGKVGE